MPEKTTLSVLQSAQQTLNFARDGQADFDSGGERKIIGLFSAVTRGRSVGFVLQNLSSKVEDFHEWYDPWQDEFKADIVFKHFHDMRTEIEKQGTHGETTGLMDVNAINPYELARRAPRGTVETRLNDDYGRNYWHVKLPDGSMKKVYFSLTPDIGELAMTAVLKDGSQIDLGKELERWLSRTTDFYLDAVARFAAPENQKELLTIEIPKPRTVPRLGELDERSKETISRAFKVHRQRYGGS